MASFTLGIMQGRLSPPHSTRLQGFPWATWREEFAHAAELKFETIEWLFEAERFDENPIWTAAGREEITRVCRETGVEVRSVCADYFMPHPFFRAADGEISRSIKVLQQLIGYAAEIGAGVILLPVLEESEIRTGREADRLAEALAQCARVAEKNDVRLGLETELPAPDYKSLIRKIDAPTVGAYYDTGNAAACGFDTLEALRELREELAGVHFKDRPVGGSTKMLGEGAANLGECARFLSRTGFEGPVILQPWFDADYLGCARANLDFVLGEIARGA